MNKKAVSYTQAMAELNELVEKMQSEELDIDELSGAVRRAMELIILCRKKIQSTEIEIKKIIEEFENEEKQ